MFCLQPDVLYSCDSINFREHCLLFFPSFTDLCVLEMKPGSLIGIIMVQCLMDADDWGLPLVSLQTKQKHFLQVQPNRLFGLVLYFGQT